MTDPTPTPAPSTTAVVTLNTGYLAWFKAHERFLVIVLLVVLGWHFWGTGLQAWADHEKRLASSADAANVLVQLQLKDLKAQNEALNAKLDATMAARAVATEKQKQVDAKATPTDLAARIQALLQAGHVTVDTTPAAVPGTLVLDPDAGHKVAADEEDLVQLKLDKADITSQFAACTALGVQKDAALVSEQTARAADVKALKADAKTQFRKGFKRGVLVTIVAAIGIKIAMVVH